MKRKRYQKVASSAEDVIRLGFVPRVTEEGLLMMKNVMLAMEQLNVTIATAEDTFVLSSGKNDYINLIREI